MSGKELESIDRIINALNALDQNKLYIISIVAIIMIVVYFLKWYFAHKANQKFNKSLNDLTDIFRKHDATNSSILNRLSGILEEIRDRQKNIISKNDSIKIILNKFNDVIKKEITSAFEWSLINNNYESREVFVRKKIKVAIGGIIISAKKSLEEFNLSVDLNQFFITYINERDQNVHFKLVDILWDEVEPIYHKENYKGKNVTDQQLEEMQIAVSNVITAELTKIQMEVNNIYR